MARGVAAMGLLSGFRVTQLGRGLAAAICGRMFADVGAEVTAIDPDHATPLALYLNHGKPVVGQDDLAAALAAARLVICEGRPGELRARGHDPEALRRLGITAPLVYISPFGLCGSRADDPASDLTLFYSSGIARLLTGQVDDLGEAPIHAVGRQSAFIGGLAAACAGMHAALLGGPVLIDVSIEEALATMAVGELANAGLAGKARPRRRVGDGNGATVTILPASDGYVAISPREERQWVAWLEVMGAPGWGRAPRFLTKPDRIANWDALHALMSEWSRHHPKQWLADRAQAAHVPSFPLREPAEQLASPQLAHRGFWRPITIAGREVAAPGPPFGPQIAEACAAPQSSFPRRREPRASDGNWPLGARFRGGDEDWFDLRDVSPRPIDRQTGVGPMPLAGVRVLDFSWVIAGPTATRYLAAMGAEIIKIEAPGRGDPGRSSELHTVLGQAKRGVVLDLKQPRALAVAKALAARSDVLIENFATGVMDRLGLGADALRELNPDLVYVSASGLGRSGPEAYAVAYGTLLQCYAGFAGLNRHPDVPPRVGFAWLDPMCGLMLAFVVAAALWQRRRTGEVARVDFSMIEAMLWTMAEPLLQTQLGTPPTPRGNTSDDCAPHGAWRCAGASDTPFRERGGAGERDDWLALAATGEPQWRRLCAVVPALAQMADLGFAERSAQRTPIEAALAAWLGPQNATDPAKILRHAGVPADALATALDLVADPHLRERGFWDAHKGGVIPGLPWRASFGCVIGPAPGLGADTDAVLGDILGYSPARIAALRTAGALG
jgi:crotonobetainyl-CoA:carnitine CoA-transferase CaiB-like acyl-CoA transferase